MTEMEKTLRDRLLGMEPSDSVSGRILKRSLLEAEGRLSLRKRVESGILTVAGAVFLMMCLHSLQKHNAGWWNSEFDNILVICEVSSVVFSVLLIAVAGWESLKGRSNRQLAPPLKAAGIAGSLFMLVVMGFWWLVVPSAVSQMNDKTQSPVYMGVVVTVVTIACLALIGIGATVSLYWLVCRESARTRERILETQCMIAEMMERSEK